MTSWQLDLAAVADVDERIPVVAPPIAIDVAEIPETNKHKGGPPGRPPARPPTTQNIYIYIIYIYIYNPYFRLFNFQVIKSSIVDIRNI